MVIELKPEQQRILERAMATGLTLEEVVDRAFASVDEQSDNLDWMLADRASIAAQIEEGYQQAERGELIDPDEALRVLHERRASRQVA
jgi:predicted transcriptional regulator